MGGKKDILTQKYRRN